MERSIEELTGSVLCGNNSNRMDWASRSTHMKYASAIYFGLFQSRIYSIIQYFFNFDKAYSTTRIKIHNKKKESFTMIIHSYGPKVVTFIGLESFNGLKVHGIVDQFAKALTCQVSKRRHRGAAACIYLSQPFSHLLQIYPPLGSWKFYQCLINVVSLGCLQQQIDKRYSRFAWREAFTNTL